MKKWTVFPCVIGLSLQGLPPAAGFAQAPQPPPPAPVTASPALEDPTVLRASQFLGPAIAAGPYHRVRELIPTDGYLAHYTVDTDFGSFEITGTIRLNTFIQEVQAIAKLNAVSRSDIFADGLRRSLEAPIDAAKNIVTHPVDTVKAVPSTVGHFFKKIGNSISTTASTIRERSNQPEGVDTGAAAVQGLSKAGKGILGFEKAKLDCARQLGVDPYSDNARLQDEMEKVAWVFWSGGLPLRVGGMVTGAGLAIGLTKFTGLPQDIYEVTPDELRLRDNRAMQAMLAPEEVRNAFNANPALTVSLRHSMLISLAELNSAQGRAAAIALAADCENRRQARFLDGVFRLMAMRETGGAPHIKEIKMFGRIPAAVDAAGTLVLTLPVDYVSWTPEVSEFVNREEFAGLKPHVYLTGDVSPLARKNLTGAGWVLHQL